MISRFFYFFLSFLILFCCRQDNKKYTHDIGYIDPKESFGDKTFKSCTNQIYQYYNFSPKGGYKHGKKAFTDSVLKKYLYSGSDSGYLTIRFIVNCNGYAGGYQIYENNLELTPTKFNSELVNHLFKITQGLNEWSISTIDGKSVDYYSYITYKLRNGKILEILP